MKAIIVSTCLKTVMDDATAARLGEVCNFSENALAAILGGVAVRIIGYDAERVKLRITEAFAIKDVVLRKAEQRVDVYYTEKRYAKTAEETNYYSTNRQKSDSYSHEVFIVTSTAFDVDELEDVVDFEYI